MSTLQILRQRLLSLDGQSYGAYKSVKGQYSAEGFSLSIDYVQGDPFASPSSCSVVAQAGWVALPEDFYRNEIRAIALEDFLIRQFYRLAAQFSRDRGMGHSGRIEIPKPSQAVLERSAAFVDPSGDVTVRFNVGLPAQGRRILGRQAAEMLCEDVPRLVEQALRFQHLDNKALRQQVEVVEDTAALREALAGQNLIAFIPDGAMLARRSGIDERPLPEGKPWRSPESLRVTFHCPNCGNLSGTGIPKGITVVVGGGYHGKSTLLHAIEQGVYNHIPGDGREYLVSDPTAVKIRAEDGRSVAGVDISSFINHLPNQQSTQQFSTENASGSTSQAASILEALEAGSRTLLIDEDTSATNFMIRDRRMQALIAKEREPITPFLDRVRQLADEHQVSTILVMGGSGDYFEVADTVIAMDQYVPEEATEQAKAIAQAYQTQRLQEATGPMGTLGQRRPQHRSAIAARDLAARGLATRGLPEEERRVKRKVRGLDTILIDEDEIDLDAVEQLIESGQLRAIAAALVYLKPQLTGEKTVAQLLDQVEVLLDNEGLESLSDRPTGEFVMFRRQELAAALNRWRALG